jgi:sulfotransferase family protein
LPISRLDKGFRIAVGVKEFLKFLTSGIARGETQDPPEQRENRPRNQKSTRQRMPEHKKKIKSIRRELTEKRRERSQIARDLRAARRKVDYSEHKEQTRRMKSKQQEIFLLSNELHIAKAGTEGEPQMGSLPDFVVIGAPKCGTTYLYHLLSKHAHVEPAAFKEVHYFDLLFEKGTEWYRQCFPPSRHKDGQRTITGEATPGYLFHPHAAKRMAKVIPEARLIALLRNPVDRMYSAFHFFQVRHGRQKGTFEETIATSFDCGHENHLLEQGNYVDHLLRWARFFSREQMLVLKSEEFFEYPQETLTRVLEFLELPEWKPDASELHDKRNEGRYEQMMDPTIRRRLEEYFEPHNRRLYEYLGVDFGW